MSLFGSTPVFLSSVLQSFPDGFFFSDLAMPHAWIHIYLFGVCVQAHVLAWLRIVMEAKTRCPLCGAFSENRTMTNSRDGCGVSGTSITVHLITHPFWSGPSSECGICHGVSPSAQQLCNRLTTLLPSLSVSLCLFIFPFILLMGGSAGWHELLAAHRQTQSSKPPAVSGGTTMRPKVRESLIKRDVRVQGKTKAEGERNSKPDRVNEFTSTMHIYIFYSLATYGAFGTTVNHAMSCSSTIRNHHCSILYS